MLAISPTASDAIRPRARVCDRSRRRGPAVLARAADRARPGDPDLRRRGPPPTNVVVETPGGQAVYLEPETADALDDQVLDADVDELGERVEFTFRPQG